MSPQLYAEHRSHACTHTLIGAYRSGGYILGFRLDPPDKLDSMCKEVTSLYSVYQANPIFGVEYQEEDKVIHD